MALGRGGGDCGLKARGGGEVRNVRIRSGRQGIVHVAEDEILK